MRNQRSLDTPHCRLFVIPARNAHVALVLRRGPSRWYHVLRWRTDIDTFEAGAWFRGRIYEEKCDISPDGTLMVYFCHGGSWREGYTDSWTAVSRAPWLFALGLWPSGTTYGGGGHFFDNRNLSVAADRIHPDHPAHGLAIVHNRFDYQQSSGEVDDADWSGYDRSGSLIFSRFGKLFRRDSKGRDCEVADFADLRPNPVPAPDWARKPLVSAKDAESMLKHGKACK